MSGRDASANDESLTEERERAIAQLCEQFAGDHLQIEEFEVRVKNVHEASSVAAFEEILRLPSRGPAPANARALVQREPRLDVAPPRRGGRALGTLARDRLVFALFSGAERRGDWAVGRTNRVVTIMGGAVVDLRDVALPPDEEIRINVLSIFGGAHILVPPDAAVTTSGVALFGGFDGVNQNAPAGAPRIRVNGVALFGGVHVESRLPGETASAARRRRREEKKALRDGPQEQQNRGR